MEGATSTLPRRTDGALAGLRALTAERWARIGLVALCAATAAVFVVWPTYPNFDSYYSLIWGREVLAGDKPSFDGYVTPTQHPLWVAFGAFCSLFGSGGDRLLLATVMASFVVLVSGVYALGRAAFGASVGLVAAIVLCTRFDFSFLAVRGYVDIPFLALVVWAAVLEVRRPREGTRPLLLLMLAAMLRPEAWVLSGLYWLYLVPRATWRQRIGWAAIVGIGPVVWASLDLWATGDPMFSLNHTSGLAEELGRSSQGLADGPRAVRAFLIGLTNLAIFLAGLAGIVLALWYAPRRTRIPLGLFGAGMLTFAMVVTAGLSIIQRYMLVPSLMLMVFAGVTLAGWTMLRQGAVARRRWRIAAVVLALVGGAYTVLRVDLSTYPRELAFRGEAHDALEQVLRSPQVAAGLRCGPLSVPTHKLQPDSRWILDLPASQVIARSEYLGGSKGVTPEDQARVDRNEQRAARSRRAARTGVALVVHERGALTRQVFVDRNVAPLVNSPPAGFSRAAVSRYYSAYVRCA